MVIRPEKADQLALTLQSAPLVLYGMGGAGGLFQTAFLPLRHRRHGKYG